MRLESERLLLRKYEMSDREDAYQVISKREISDSMITIPHPYPKELVESWLIYLQSSFEGGTAYEFAVTTKTAESLYIGNCGLVTVRDEHRHAELGYLIDPNYWNQGYATEACQAVLKFAFYELQLNRVYARVMKHNYSSCKVLEKLGFQLEGTARQEFIKDGNYVDIVYYALLAEDYQEK